MLINDIPGGWRFVENHCWKYHVLSFFDIHNTNNLCKNCILYMSYYINHWNKYWNINVVAYNSFNEVASSLVYLACLTKSLCVKGNKILMRWHLLECFYITKMRNLSIYFGSEGRTEPNETICLDISPVCLRKCTTREPFSTDS